MKAVEEQTSMKEVFIKDNNFKASQPGGCSESDEEEKDRELQLLKK